jgi:phospholipid/cholesterol/gamma-HCH transport system substrate-binding protein
MEKSLSKEIKVGIFTVVGVVAFLMSILLLGGDKFFLKSTYRLRVELPDVQGLGKGSVVSLEGVPVGNVKTLRFMPDSKRIEVAMDIDSQFRDRITIGAKASSKTQGALGDKYIFIESGPLQAQPLANNALIEAATEGDLIDVLSKKGAELGQIIEVIKEVRQLFHEINADGRSAKLMTNLVADSDSLKNLITEARETMSSVRQGPIMHLDSILKKIDRGDGTLGALVNDPTLHSRLTQMLGGSARNKFLTPVIRESIKETEH